MSNSNRGATAVVPDALYVIFAGPNLLCRSGALEWQPLAGDTAPNLPPQIHEPQSLGNYQGKPCQLLVYSEAWELPPNLEWQSVRDLLFRGAFSNDAFQLVSTSMQLHFWRRDHQYCGRCGKPTQRHDTERAMVCGDCDIHYYPRLSPCIITVITRGQQCLLARNQKYRTGLYSALAGFVEAGETLEQCLRREVMEEVGVEVGDIHYFGSQPWPFPGQLMVGFHAEYKAGDICVDGEEITDAQWWHYGELPEVPPPSTLSGQLIRAFVEHCEANEVRGE